MKKKKTKTPRTGRPRKDVAPRVLGTRLDEGLQEELRQYAREVSAAKAAKVSHSDLVTEAVRSWPPFRRWQKARQGA